MLKAFISCFFIITAMNVISQERMVTFEEISGKTRNYYYYEYSLNDNGYIIRSVKIYKNDTLEIQILTTDNQYNSLQWEYIRNSDHTHMMAKLDGDYVQFAGQHDGERIEEVFELDGYKWIQIFPMNPGLNDWIQSGEEEIRFWIICNAGPADMEINKFVATNEGIETLEILNNNLDCWNIEMTLSGWRSLFWSGNYFYSKQNLYVVKYDGGGAPGDPSSVTTMIFEK